MHLHCKGNRHWTILRFPIALVHDGKLETIALVHDGKLETIALVHDGKLETIALVHDGKLETGFEREIKIKIQIFWYGQDSLHVVSCMDTFKKCPIQAIFICFFWFTA